MEIKNIFNKTNLQKLGAALMAGTVIVGGGLCYAHEHKDDFKHHDCAAYVQEQAAAQNITLIDEDKVKNIAAQAIGIKESNLNFYKIHLKSNKHSADFKPVYKVECFANGIKYSLRIDAVSGEIIKDYGTKK